MTPEELENILKQQRASRNTLLTKLEVNKKLSGGSLLSNPQQLKGLDRLVQDVYNRIESLKTKSTSQLTSYAEQLNIENIASASPTLPTVCPTPEKLDQVLKSRDNLVSEIENVAKYVNIVNISLQTVSRVLNGTTTTLSALNTLKTATSLAAKVAPTLPGAVTGLISDLDDIRTLLTFKTDGTPRLQQYQRAIDTGATATNQASKVLNSILTVLAVIDRVLKNCGKQPADLGEDVKTLIETVITANSSNTQTMYKGFIFEIVEKPYSPTLDQKIGQAKNKEGIVLLQTEPSFTNNPQQLIEELKLIIDRDNLKAD